MQRTLEYKAHLMSYIFRRNKVICYLEKISTHKISQTEKYSDVKMKLFQKQLFRRLLIRTVLSFKVKLSNPAIDEADPTVVVFPYKAYLKIEETTRSTSIQYALTILSNQSFFIDHWNFTALHFK